MKFFSRTGDKVVFWTLIALVALTLIFSALRRFAGLALVHGELYVYLPLVIALLLIGWGMSGIFRRLSHRVARTVVGAVMVLIMLVLSTLGMTYAGIVAGLSFPQRYIDVVSPNAHNRLIVMRGFDSDEDRINARHEARVAVDPEGDPAADYGYTFTAYAPAMMDFFYKVDSLTEGEVYIGYASQAQLMVEWEDDETVGHFYVKDPETADGGEMRAKAA